MKLSENFILKNIAGAPVVVPVGDAVNNIKGMITLNGPAETIWRALEDGKDFDGVLAVLISEYNAPENVLKADLTAFLDKLRAHKILED